jgi:small ligand-binding sensory domain FIST
MRFLSAVSENESTDAAVEDVINAARTSGVKADVLFVFFTAHHREEADSIAEKLWLQLDPQVALGCSGEGIIGGEKEIERVPGLSILIGQTPGVRLHPFHIGADDWRPMLRDPKLFIERAGHGPETRAFIGFGDPFTTPMNQFLQLLDTATPDSPLIGGMASSARKPGENALLRNDEILTDGFVGVSLSGPIEIETVLSQGCRPIGRTFVITKARENVIEQLGGKPALAVVKEIIDELKPQDKELLSHGLLLGRVISEYRDTFGRGDFLVRNVMGVDQESGAIAVTDLVRPGQTVQFHVHDAATATEDLTHMLEPQSKREPAAGGLLFSCNGRGTHMFSQTCHDISHARKAMPQTPIAGFFANGEIGPVANQNFIHGHTASFALFRPK